MSVPESDAWNAALYVVEKLRAGNHVALLAGGCVRDRLMAISPKDYDVATDATPKTVKKIFPWARRVGAKFGVMLVRRHGHDIEVATFRADGTYSDGRHPDEVRFGNQEEDAQRRDFTINGLFLDPTTNRIIDYVDGQKDITGRVLRTIGDAARRFGEDHLRMLRAVRFAARLGFTIDPPTLEAIRQHAHRLEVISAERVWLEFGMILTAPSRVTGWELLLKTGLRAHLVKEWPADEIEDEQTTRWLTTLPPRYVDVALAMAVCLRNCDSKRIERICRALRTSKQLIEVVSWLVTSLPMLHNEDSLETADLKLLMARPAWPVLLELFEADLAASRQNNHALRRLQDRAGKIPEGEINPPPLVSGADVSDLGLPPGPTYGRVLDEVYRAQLNGVIGSREDALKMLRRLVRSL